MLDRMKLGIIAVVMGGAMAPSQTLSQQASAEVPPVFHEVPFAAPKEGAGLQSPPAQSDMSRTLAARCAKPNSPPIPKNIATWIRVDDYPVQALREERGGRVTFRILVNKLGLPARVVILTAAYKDLGEATAKALMRRSRFVPARRKCVTVRGTFSGAINWVIPV